MRSNGQEERERPRETGWEDLGRKERKGREEKKDREKERKGRAGGGT